MATRRGPADRLGRRADDRPVRVVRVVLRGRGPRGREGARPVPPRRGGARPAGRVRVRAASTSASSSGASRRCSACPTTGSSSGCSPAARPTTRMLGAVEGRARRRGQDRADLELLGRRPLPAGADGRALRRRGDLRHRRDPQARAGDLRDGRRGGRAARRRSASSWTTWASTSSRRRSSGWPRSCTRDAAQTIVQLEDCSA